MNPREALFAHRFFLRVALALLEGFLWVLILQWTAATEGNFLLAFIRTAFLYALVQVTIFLLTPYSGRQLRNGIRRLMLSGVVLVALSFLMIGEIGGGSLYSYEGVSLVVLALLLGSYRAFYWIPYRVESSELATHPKRSLSFECFIALMPVVGGLILSLTNDGITIVTSLAALVALISLYFLLYLPDAHEGFAWQYRETFVKLFSNDNRRALMTSFCQGVEQGALLFLWPITIVFAMGASYKTLGAIVSITFLLIILVRNTLQRTMRHSRLHESLVVQSLIASSSWILRLSVASPTGVIVADLFPRAFGAKPQGMGEYAADNGTYIDEFTALKEMGLSLGRVTCILVTVCIAASSSLSFAFLVAFLASAVCAGGSVLFSRSKSHVV